MQHSVSNSLETFPMSESLSQNSTFNFIKFFTIHFMGLFISTNEMLSVIKSSIQTAVRWISDLPVSAANPLSPPRGCLGLECRRKTERTGLERRQVWRLRLLRCGVRVHDRIAVHVVHRARGVGQWSTRPGNGKGSLNTAFARPPQNSISCPLHTRRTCNGLSPSQPVRGRNFLRSRRRDPLFAVAALNPTNGTGTNAAVLRLDLPFAPHRRTCNGPSPSQPARGRNLSWRRMCETRRTRDGQLFVTRCPETKQSARRSFLSSLASQRME